MTKFRIIYALYNGRCALADIFREVVSSKSRGFNRAELAGRFIGVRLGEDGRSIEGSLRISFASSEYLPSLLKLLRRSKIAYKLIYRGRNNVVVLFKYRPACGVCPLVKAIDGAIPKTMLVTPLGLLFEFITYNANIFKSEHFKVLVSGTAKEMMSYMLTPREQEVLYYAYFKGYYAQPRAITMEQLSKELGISKSGLNEILRRAEGKIIKACMRHDLPHLILAELMMAKKVQISS